LHSTTQRAGTLIAGILVAVMVAACGSGGTSLYGGTPPSPAGGGAQAGAGGGSSDSISIATPADGATVTVPFDVQLDASVPLGPPESGEHHAHLYFDTDTSSADYDIVYGDTWQVTRQLTPGKHTITVALANPDHSLAGPTQSITVTVG
jgi:hypothetical protein